MMLTTRELPPEEWSKLAGTELDASWRGFPPEHVRVVVVEEDGQIVGQCAVMTWIHAEGFGVHPAYRRSGSVWRRLLHGIGAVIRESGAGGLVAGSATDTMSKYLTRLGGVPLPMTFYVVRMNRFFKQKE